MGDGRFVSSYRTSDWLGAPGLYGMSYGFASYGMPQTYSVFSAYPGPSYGTNYPPYGVLPGRFGVGLWRPGFVQAGYVYGASYYPDGFSYRTFPIGAQIGMPGGRAGSLPPVGVYAPARTGLSLRMVTALGGHARQTVAGSRSRPRSWSSMVPRWRRPS